jgi:hypothetical protein
LLATHYAVKQRINSTELQVFGYALRLPLGSGVKQVEVEPIARYSRSAARRQVCDNVITDYEQPLGRLHSQHWMCVSAPLKTKFKTTPRPIIRLVDIKVTAGHTP